MPQLVLSSDSNEGGYKFSLQCNKYINWDLPTEYRQHLAFVHLSL